MSTQTGQNPPVLGKTGDFEAAGGGRQPPSNPAASLIHPRFLRLRSSSGSTDYPGTGLVWNAVNLSPEQPGHGVSLKVTVVCDSLREPLTFTCDCECDPARPGEAGIPLFPPFPTFPTLPPFPTGSSTVDLLIYQALCYTHDELHAVDVEDFLLKICGLEEFLQK